MSGDGLAARRAALRAIRAVADGAFSNVAVPNEVEGLDAARDRSFASHLAYDTLRWRGTLDWALDQVATRGIEAIETDLLDVLRLGALQLLFSDVPAHAAVATSVDLAKESVPAARAEGAGGFVNGVLRGLSRAELAWPDAEDDQVDHLALTTGHPAWIVAELLERLDPHETEAVLNADNDPPGLTLRACGDRDALVTELRDAGQQARPGKLAPEAVRVPGGDPRRLAAVRDGRAAVQDEASMLVGHATGAGPGDRILDLCAGPGGKTIHLATLASPDGRPPRPSTGRPDMHAGGSGRVVALERHHSRARLVSEAVTRLTPAAPVHVVTGDALAVPLRAGFDIVLVDAPCTGLGAGRRRPDVRWRRQPDDVAALGQLQSQLLDIGLGLLRPGGRLTYAVCTWTHAETTARTESVLERPEIELVEQRQLLPHRDGTDGMYYAVFESG